MTSARKVLGEGTGDLYVLRVEGAILFFKTPRGGLQNDMRTGTVGVD